MEKRLTRVEEGKMLCGVCAGIGKYFNIDPTLVRLGFVILSCFGGSGMLAFCRCGDYPQGAIKSCQLK